MLENRIRPLNHEEMGPGPVVYWMNREHRVRDNWALIHAQNEAVAERRPLLVVFCLLDSYLGAQSSHYDFMKAGLDEVYGKLADLHIPFYLLEGDPPQEILKFAEILEIGSLVTDFHSLRPNRRWRDQIAAKIKVSFQEVDARNIVPCWIASSKAEYAAYTIRPKIQRNLDIYLDSFPSMQEHPFLLNDHEEKVSKRADKTALILKNGKKPNSLIVPGEKAALEQLDDFLASKIGSYEDKRNDPNEEATSKLSAHLHFGHLSAQRAAFETKKYDIESAASFLEELIIRRELSDNYCYYHTDYDKFSSFPSWAKKTLDEHRKDPRNYHYSVSVLEAASTHDRLWNAAQKEMMVTGFMPGYVRMYWAKKILEWSLTPEEALDKAIYLNNKYLLDGRDANGYTGIAWSLGGVHDRAWKERPIFGKVRYMSYEGSKRKFDVDQYVKRIEGLYHSGFSSQ